MSEATGGAPDPKAGGEGEKEKMIRFEDHKRALDDLHKFKKQAQEKEAELARIESERLREKEDWKTIAEKAEADKAKLAAEYGDLKTSITQTRKFNAVHAAAIKAGIRSEAVDDLSLLKLDGLEIETTSEGRYMTHGADEMVENLKKTRPHWFAPKDVSQINSGGARQIDNGLITPAMLLEAEKKGKAEYLDLYARYKKQTSKI